jgi:hypothetical protein
MSGLTSLYLLLLLVLLQSLPLLALTMQAPAVYCWVHSRCYGSCRHQQQQQQQARQGPQAAWKMLKAQQQAQ